MVSRPGAIENQGSRELHVKMQLWECSQIFDWKIPPKEKKVSQISANRGKQHLFRFKAPDGAVL